jgi:ribosomal protein L39E
VPVLAKAIDLNTRIPRVIEVIKEDKVKKGE